MNYLRLEFRTVPAPGPLGLNFICHDNLESMSESMHSIVFDWQNRLKMPRPDAYGERAAMIMSLLQSARLNKIEPWVYLKDVLTRLPTQLNSKLDELLPHLWKPAIAG